LIVLLCTSAFASEDSERLYSRGLVEFHARHYEQALSYFDRAVAADPNDVYARYYRGTTRGRLNQLDGAIEDFRAVIERKPDFDEARLDLGVALVNTGAYAEAVPLLQQAQQAPDLEANASLFLGVALLRLQQLDAARTAFERAAQRDPALGVSARYYLGLLAREQGRWEEADQHLTYVSRTSPSSAMGREATAFLGRPREAVRKSWQVYGALGFEYDSNVVLAGEDVGISEEDDGRFTITAGGRYIPWRNENFLVMTGYEFFQSIHFDLTDFNLQDHRPEVQFVARWDRLRFGLLTRYEYFIRDTDSFLSQATGSPWFSVEEGSFGRTEVYYRARLRDFKGSEFEARDAVNQAPGIRQYLYLGSPDRFLSAGYQFDREDPNYDNNDANRFAYDGHEVSLGLGWDLPGEVISRLVYAYRHEQYPEDSLYANSLFDAEPGIVTSHEGRLDKVHQVMVVLRRPLGSYLQLAAAYLGTFNGSNDSEFDYDRHIGSLFLEARY
jgi:tetratricopeptide (TPR) repeat protein